MEHATPWLLIVLLIGLVALGLAVRRRVLFRMAVRNAGRRKTQVALVIAGLLVATSILSGSFVVGDSLQFAIRGGVFEELDHVDESIVLGGEQEFFGSTNYTDLAAQQAKLPHVDGLAPRIVVVSTVLHPEEQLSEARANLIGFDPASDPGVFVLSDGTEANGSALVGDRVYINEELADAIQAEAGSSLTLFLEVGPAQVEVADVLRSEGKALWDHDPNLFMPLPRLQEILGREDEINHIVVSNTGGVEGGYLVTEEAIEELDAALGPDHPFTILDLKRHNVAQADVSADQLTQLFTLLGVFTILAGLMLIMSIIVMLAEERKTEMGIQRAVGLRRSHLTQLFSLEGFLYAMAAGAIGAVAGLAVAAVILFAISQIAFEGIELRWQTSSLLLGFALGFLLTLSTIFAASARISRLNIVRAIRNIPEPIPRRMTWGQIAVGAILTVFGLTALLLGYSSRTVLYFSSGLGLLVLGIAVLLHKVVGPRRAFTAASLILIAWQIVPILSLFPDTPPGIDLFIATGLMMITGGVLLVVFNNNLILGFLSRTVGRRKKFEPVLRIAVAYPMARRGRTGLILAIFALIVFTIVVMASIQSLIGSSLTAFERQASGGYDIFGVSNPEATLVDPMGNKITFADRLAASSAARDIEYHEELLFGRGTVTPQGGESLFYELYGIETVFAERNGFTLYRRAEEYATDREVWQDVLTNPDLVVVDRNVQPVDFGPSLLVLEVDVGDEVVVANQAGHNHTVRIVGILDSQIVRGLFMNGTFVREQFGASDPSFFMFKLNPGVDELTVGREIERTFITIQMQTFAIRPLIEENTEVTNAFFDLLEGYLAMGLLVGIAGLGIITMRNVVERRQEIGALRAVGFRRSMVLKSLLIETSYVAVVGIVIGVLLGILLGYRIWVDFLPQAEEFLIPWNRILLISAVAYVAALATTISPSLRAARLPPAEALRYVE